jgi:hypothetical protein
MQPTSAKICGICGRQNFAFPHKGAKFAKAQIRSTKNTTKHKVHEDFFKTTKGIFAQQKYLRESCIQTFDLSMQPTSAKICGICGRQNFAFPHKGAKFAKAQIRRTKDTTKHKCTKIFPRPQREFLLPKVRKQKYLRESALNFASSIHNS